MTGDKESIPRLPAITLHEQSRGSGLPDRKTNHRYNDVINPDHKHPTIYALSSGSGRILTEKENVCVGISVPYRNKNGAEKTFNAMLSCAS
jgi:hypothetical protein